MKFATGVIICIAHCACTSMPKEVIYDYKGLQSFSDQQLNIKLASDIAFCDLELVSGEEKLLNQEREHQVCMYHLGWSSNYQF